MTIIGYTTDFSGVWNLDKPVDEETYQLLDGLNNTRRMWRDAAKLAKRLGITKKECLAKYGGDGCPLYIANRENLGQNKTPDVPDSNSSKGRPSLWCQWAISKDHTQIFWDGGEKFYEYVAWIQFILDMILIPRGYVLNGTVSWQGEESDDSGEIQIVDNEVTVRFAVTYYCTSDEARKIDRVVQLYRDNPLKELVDVALEDE